MLFNCRMLVGLGLLSLALAGQADVAEAWKKARTLTGIVRDDAPRASVQVKCGKVSRKGVASVSMAVTPFFGKKASYRAQKVTLPEAGAVVVEWPDGARVEIADGRISGGLPGGRALEAWTPGSALANGAAFDLETDGLADVLSGLFKQYLPVGLSVQSDARGRWTVAGGAKAGKVVYRRGTQTIDESKLGANPAGLKLTYTPKTGLFKGSFKAWQDVKGKIKGVAAKVAGIMVDGKGFGEAQIGKLAPVAVRIVGGVTPAPGPDPQPQLGGVQLWKNGPYWAECNVGASKPEEYGYYFWWGDTVGYTRRGGVGTFVVDEDEDEGFYYYIDGVTWVSSTGTRISSDSDLFCLDSFCPTDNKSISALKTRGYIDAKGNLMPKYDAATVHLGAPWRMPTIQEIDDLVNNCTTTWTMRNGVFGRLVTGKGVYVSRSIFLPAAGDGDGSSIFDPGSYGYCWSSTPTSGSSDRAWSLDLDSRNCYRRNHHRCFGRSVRPLRGFAK